MAKVIALRFDTVKEVSTLKSLIEVGLNDPQMSPRDKKVGEEILKCLNGCADLFLERASKEKAKQESEIPIPFEEDVDMESTENKRFAGSMQDNTQAMKASACDVCDD